MAGRRLTPLHVVELSAALSSLDIIAYGYMNIDRDKIKNIRKENPVIEDGNIELIEHWIKQNDVPDQLQQFATILYKAAKQGAYADKGKIRAILGVTEEEVLTPASGGATGGPSGNAATLVKRELSNAKMVKLAAKITSKSQLTNLAVALDMDPNAVSVAMVNNPGDFMSAAHEVMKAWVANQKNRIDAFKEMRTALEKAELASLIEEVLMK